MEKRKKKHGIYNPRKENPVQIIKIAAIKKEIQGKKKKKLTSNGPSNSSCNFVTNGVESKSLFGLGFLITQFSVSITHNSKMVGPIAKSLFGKQ